MSSESGGHDTESSQDQDDGKAFDASHLNLSSDEKVWQNSVGGAVCSKDGCRSRPNLSEKYGKSYNISSKLASNGGLVLNSKAGTSGTSFIKDLQQVEKSLNHLLLRFISTLLKLEISTLLKTITNSCFQAL